MRTRPFIFAASLHFFILKSAARGDERKCLQHLACSESLDAAISAEKSGDYRTAYLNYASAYGKLPELRLLYNMGRMCFLLGNFAKGTELLDNVLEESEKKGNVALSNEVNKYREAFQAGLRETVKAGGRDRGQVGLHTRGAETKVVQPPNGSNASGTPIVGSSESTGTAIAQGGNSGTNVFVYPPADPFSGRFPMKQPEVGALLLERSANRTDPSSGESSSRWLLGVGVPTGIIMTVASVWGAILVFYVPSGVRLN